MKQTISIASSICIGICMGCDSPKTMLEAPPLHTVETNLGKAECINHILKFWISNSGNPTHLVIDGVDRLTLSDTYGSIVVIVEVRPTPTGSSVTYRESRFAGIGQPAWASDAIKSLHR